MAARRPSGKRHDTVAGRDEIAPSQPVQPAPRRRAARGARPAAAAPDQGVDPDVLDARERRQKPTRKPAGPAGGRSNADDVVLPQRRVADTEPSDPA